MWKWLRSQLTRDENAQGQKPKREVLRLEELESRVTPSWSQYEVYAVALINEMRENPTGFAEELRQLYHDSSYVSNHGMRGDDPVWQDLRAFIDQAEEQGDWQSGFNGTEGTSFLSVMQELPSTRGLAMVLDLHEAAESHNDWMHAHGQLTHTSFAPGDDPARSPISWLTYGGNAPYDTWYENIARAENIASGEVGTHLQNAYDTGELSTFEYKTRTVYFDTVAYMLEADNVDLNHPWGHLHNLATEDPLVGDSGVGIFNAIGVDYNFYNDNSQMLSTQRLAWHEDTSYASGLIYQDNNNNGFYDPGEGLKGNLKWSIGPYTSGGVEMSDGGELVLGPHGDFTKAFGVGPGGIPLGTEVTVKATYGGREVGRYTFQLDEGNQWIEFRMSPSFGLVERLGEGTGIATLEPDAYETPGNDTWEEAVDLGSVSTHNPNSGAALGLSTHHSGDVDWFRFELAGQATKSDRIFLGFDQIQGDLDAVLYLLEADGTLTEVLEADSTTDNEIISLEGLDAGVYYLKVSGYNDATNFYTLKLDALFERDAATQSTLVPHLQAVYQFRAASQEFFNAAKMQEKWFQDQYGNWFAITPDGGIYEWIEGRLENNVRIATVSPLVYHDLNILFDTDISKVSLLEAYREVFGFKKAREDYSFNIFRRQERWFVDRHGRDFFITFDGTIHQWKGGDQTNTVARGRLTNSMFYQDPKLLFVTSSTVLSAEVEFQLALIEGTFQFKTTTDFQFNIHGKREKWFQDSKDRWFVLTPDGSLIRWDGSSLDTSPRLLYLPQLIYERPELLLEADGDLASGAPTAYFQMLYGFQRTSSYYINSQGMQEKWIKDRDGRWFAITPDGSLYRYENGDLQASSKVGDLNPIVYRLPSLLFNAPIKLASKIKSGLAELRRLHGFRFHNSFYENHYGYRERWFQDRNDEWFIITPDGKIRKWNGKSIQTSEVIAKVAAAVYDEPDKLFNAVKELPANALAQLQVLQRNFGFRFHVQYHQDHLNQEELWFQNRAKDWFFITSDGTIRKWDRVSFETSEVIAQVDPLVYDDPEVLFQAQATFSAATLTKIDELKVEPGFQHAGLYYRNWYGEDEKWFRDRNGLWYAMLPTGKIYLWNGTEDIKAGELVAELDGLVYDDPSVLFE
ncbi:MAG: PPC domain-containing protein [Gemmataceae bacterium]